MMNEGIFQRLSEVKYLSLRQKSKKAFWQVIPVGLISERFNLKESELSLDDLKKYGSMMIDLMCNEVNKVCYLANRQIELNEEED